MNKIVVRSARFMYFFVVFLLLVGIFFMVRKRIESNRIAKLINIVIVGVAGSGKGTQGDLIKDKFKLFKISAGDLLRDHRKNNGKFAAVINQYIDEGKLVPCEITHELIAEAVEKNVYKSCIGHKKYNGIIYDGFPRHRDQMKFLDEMLSGHNNKVNVVIYIDVPLKVLEERLSSRYSCAKCGEIYNKISKPTKVKGVCDKCHSTNFVIRQDDTSSDAIKKRFKIFEDETKVVLDEYSSRGIVYKVDGSKSPEEIAMEISKKITEVQEKIRNQIESGN